VRIRQVKKYTFKSVNIELDQIPKNEADCVSRKDAPNTITVLVTFGLSVYLFFSRGIISWIIVALCFILAFNLFLKGKGGKYVSSK
jgi:hypothetical protein